MNRIAKYFNGSLNELSYKKDGEKYLIRYDDNSAGDALRCLGRWANNEDLNLGWYDVAVLAQKVRRAHA